MTKLSIAHRAKEKKYSHFDLYQQNGQGKWEIDYVNLTAFFTERGYYVFRYDSDRWAVIRIIDNIVKQIGKKDLKDELLNHIIESKESRHMHQFFLKNIAKAVSDEFMETLPEKKVVFRKDLKNAMQIYYQNCIVKITENKITTHSYADLDGYIWESQILTRNYSTPDDFEDSDFKTFAFNVSNKDEKRFNSIRSVLGFLLHNYKNPAYCPAIILNDEVISNNPEGGTGKGIFIKAIQQFMATVTIEGKTFNFDKNFVYQQVDGDTKILSFQDVNKSFDFERLFSVLTDGITVEKKGAQAIHYGFHDTPKIVITTNYAIKGTGNSHDRRRLELEISQHYNKDRTPLQDFKKMLFDDWNAADFYRFDRFMVECCQFYLENGLIHQELINLPEKRLIAATNIDFIAFMKDFSFEVTPRGRLYDDFIHQFDEYLTQKYFTKQLFSKWVVIYAADRGYKCEDYVYNSVRHYKFTLQS